MGFMLKNLKIENIAVIENADIVFTDGFNVLSGETGAGKSIVLDSINAVLGERTSRELVRTGSRSAKVSAVFEDVSESAAEAVRQLGIETAEDNAFLIQRSIGADGKNICRVNGQPVTVAMLKSIGRELVNIHGQHDSQALLDSEKHCSFIDAMAENEEPVFRYRSSFDTLCSLRRELEAARLDESEKLRRLDLLSFQIDEIEKAQPVPGEREALLSKREFFRNSERVIEGIRQAQIILSGDGEVVGASDALSQAAASLEDAARYYDGISDEASQAREASYSIAELTSSLASILDSLEYDPREAQQVDDRLDLLYKLSKKYGETESEILAYLENCREERRLIELSDEREQELKSEIKQCKAKTVELARELSQRRISAGERFAAAITAELAFLDMPDVRFVVNRTETVLTANGIDCIEFLISANPGEEPKPLAKIASGGELARIMLAIKCVLAGKDEVGTLVFDEIDSGVSGRAAQKIALKLSEVSNGRQVICVTHLAQIASMSDNHLLISKSVRDGQTFTAVDCLDASGRAEELARMIGGATTQLQLSTAIEMLAQAEKIKQNSEAIQ